jgi:hypothetical protein
MTLPAAYFEFAYETDAYAKGRYRVDLVTLDGLSQYLDLIAQRHDDVLEGFIGNCSTSLVRPASYP